MIRFYATYLDSEGRAHLVGPQQVVSREHVLFAVVDYLAEQKEHAFVCAVELLNPPQLLLDRVELNEIARSVEGRRAIDDHYIEQEANPP